MRIFSLYLGVVACFIAQPLWAQDAAELAPADTQTFIQINDLASLRNEPIFTLIRNQLQPSPHAKQAWEQLATALGMTPDQMTDRYFGRKLVMIDRGRSDHAMGVIVSLVSPEDMTLAVEKLGLQKTGDLHGFALYNAPQNHARIAYDGQWMAMGPPPPSQDVEAVLQAMRGPAAEKLAAQDHFKRSTTGVAPTNHTFFYTRMGDSDSHVATANKHGTDWQVDYTGTSPEFQRIHESLGSAAAQDFGPLPDDAVAAVSLNLGRHRVNRSFAQTADGLIAPRTLAADVLPNLQAPLLAFITRIPAADTVPDAPRNIGALGIAVKINSPQTGLDLTRIIDGLVSSLNIGLSAEGDEGVEIKSVQADGGSYKTVDIGSLMAKRIGRPQLAGLFQLTYGTVGSWYIVGTHEKVVEQCIAATHSPGKRFTQAADVAAMALADAPKPVLTLAVRGPLLRPLMESGLEAVRTHAPQIADAPPMRFLALAGDILAQGRGMTLQIEAGDQAPTLKARLRLLADK